MSPRIPTSLVPARIPFVRLKSKLQRHALPSTLTSTLSLTQPYSTTNEPAPPPLLLKFKTDLKTALRAKDTPRLNVLRGLLADITNASKTSSPLQTDMQIVSLMRKRQSAAKEAAAGFKAAGRDDLVGKEEGQGKVLEEYVAGVESLGEGEVRGEVRRVVKEVESSGKMSKGDVLKKLIGPGGVFEGKNVDRTVVVRIVNEVIGK